MLGHRHLPRLVGSRFSKLYFALDLCRILPLKYICPGNCARLFVNLHYWEAVINSWSWNISLLRYLALSLLLKTSSSQVSNGRCKHFIVISPHPRWDGNPIAANIVSGTSSEKRGLNSPLAGAVRWITNSGPAADTSFPSCEQIPAQAKRCAACLGLTALKPSSSLQEHGLIRTMLSKQTSHWYHFFRY